MEYTAMVLIRRNNYTVFPGCIQVICLFEPFNKTLDMFLFASVPRFPSLYSKMPSSYSKICILKYNERIIW